MRPVNIGVRIHCFVQQIRAGAGHGVAAEWFTHILLSRQNPYRVNLLGEQLKNYTFWPCAGKSQKTTPFGPFAGKPHLWACRGGGARARCSRKVIVSIVS